MAKYLRYAEVRGFLRRPSKVGADESEANRLTYLVGCPNWCTGASMYFRTALPVACSDVKKLNIYGCPDSQTFCDEPALGIASAWVNVPADPGATLVDCRSQQAFTLELAHTAILAAAEKYSFDAGSFVTAKKQVEEKDYALRFQIGKTKKSPDKKYSASVWCNFDAHFRTELVVTRSDGSEVCRYQFATTDDSSIGQLQWQGNETVHVPLTAVSGDAYWVCSVDGVYSFVFPKSEGGSAHDLYRYATMLLDGLWVMPDREAGIRLLERAADAGFKHAIRRLRMLQNNEDSNSVGGPDEP